MSEHQSLETSSRELAVREVGRGREHRDPLVKREDGIRGIPFSFDAVDEIASGSSESAVIALLGGHPVRRDWYRGGELLSLWWFSKEMLREEAGRVTGWTDLEDEVVRVSWHVALIFDNQGRHVLTLAEGVAVNSPVPTFTAGLLKSEEHMETVWYDLR